MSKLVTIYGGSGLVGRYIARRMAQAGWRVRVAVRRPNEAIFVRPYGSVGQVEPILCNIRDDASVAAAMQGADAVVNCVGILGRSGKNTFESVHVDGAARVARLAAQAGVARLVHVSALGADANSESDYARTKALGEAAVLEAYPAAVILRPSVVFGTDDKFFNRFAALSRATPVIPLVAGATKLQPVHVDDVAQAAVAGVTGAAPSGIYELGGPEVLTLRQIQERVNTVIERRRVMLPIPNFVAGIMAFGLDMAQAMTVGLFRNTCLTRDQLRSLQSDNVVAAEARGFEALGIRPTAVDTVLPEYLWPYRATGQYAAIKASARNLRS